MDLVCGSCWSRGKPAVFKVGLHWNYTLANGDDGQIIFLGPQKIPFFDPGDRDIQAYMKCAWCDNKLLMPISVITKKDERGARVNGVTISDIKNKPVCIQCGAKDLFRVTGIVEFLLFQNGPGLNVQHLIENGEDKSDSGAVRLVEKMLQGDAVPGSYLLCSACDARNVDLSPTKSAPVMNQIDYHETWNK